MAVRRLEGLSTYTDPGSKDYWTLLLMTEQEDFCQYVWAVHCIEKTDKSRPDTESKKNDYNWTFTSDDGLFRKFKHQRT